MMPIMKNTLRKSVAAAMLLGVSGAALAQGTISTIAGSGTSGFSGDGGLAVSATMSNPQGVAVDAAGNVYVADQYNGRVRKVDATTGMISTFAGGGSSYSYGIAPTTAHMWQPRNIFINGAGNMLVTDHYHDMTFFIDNTTGLLYSRCGSHSQGCEGDGGDASLAKMELPDAACEDAAGNTYLADRGCGKIRKVDATTGIVTTFVTLAGVSAVFVDPSAPNDLYAAMSYDHKIVKINITSGAVTDFVGNGTAGYSGDGLESTAALIGTPSALFIDHNHYLYFTDASYHVVRRINLVTGIIRTIAGTGTAGYTGDGDQSPLAQLNNPQGIWVDNSGYVYIADAGNNVVRKIKPKGLKSNGSPMAAKEISLYPNPTTGSFTLATDEDLNNTPVTVFNVLGAKVFNASMSGNNNVIDLSAQPAGIYTVVFQTESGMHSVKVTRN